MANVVKYSALGIPFGMSYPLTFGTDTKTFGQIMEYGTTIKNNVRHLLLTQKGEKEYDKNKSNRPFLIRLHQDTPIIDLKICAPSSEPKMDSAARSG